MITLPAKAYLQAKLKYNFVHNLFLYFKVFRRKLASIWRQQLPPSMLFFGQSWRSSSALSWWQRATNIRTPLPHIPVTAFSQTDLFSVWIYAWIQIATETSVTNCNHKHALMLTCRHVHVRPHCFIVTEARSWRLELECFAEKISKNRLVCKNAVALPYYESCRLLVMGSWLL